MACLIFGECEDIFDQFFEVLAALLYRVDMLLEVLDRIGGFGRNTSQAHLEELADVKDIIEGAAQFVAHHGKKGFARLQGFFESFAIDFKGLCVFFEFFIFAFEFFALRLEGEGSFFNAFFKLGLDGA